MKRRVAEVPLIDLGMQLAEQQQLPSLRVVRAQRVRPHPSLAGTETIPKQCSRALIQQTCRGSFSAVSKPIFATKYSFCSFFRDLQGYHSFAPLRIQYFSKFSSESFFFCKFSKFRSIFCYFSQCSSNFAPILMIFSRNFGEHSKRC